MSWGSKIERETQLRIKLACAAYAYEFEPDLPPLCSDGEFDEACRLIDLRISTTRPDLDKYWRENFDPSTGVWIHKHPELDQVEFLVWRLRNPKEYQQIVERRINRLKERIDDYLSRDHCGQHQPSGQADHHDAASLSEVHP